MESVLTAVREGQDDAVLQALLDYNAKVCRYVPMPNS